jgi:hypothetical protein
MDIHYVEMQPVGSVFPLILTAGIRSGVERRIVQLAVVGYGARHWLAVWALEIDHLDLLGARAACAGEQDSRNLRAGKCEICLALNTRRR